MDALAAVLHLVCHRGWVQSIASGNLALPPTGSPGFCRNQSSLGMNFFIKFGENHEIRKRLTLAWHCLFRRA